MSVTVNGTSGLVFGDGTIQGTAAGMPFRNRVINGDMRIDQRNNGSAVTQAINSGAFGVDRFNTGGSGAAGTTTNQRVVDAPANSGLIYSLKVTVATAATAPTGYDFTMVQQTMEGTQVYDAMYGTPNAKTATVSFWVKSSITGTFGFGLYYDNYLASGGKTYIANYTINTANTWEYKTIVVPGNTTAACRYDNNSSLSLRFGLSTGSLRQQAAGWADGNTMSTSSQTNFMATVGNTFQLTGVQFEWASAPTQFEFLPYPVQLTQCQRYYEQGTWNTIFPAPVSAGQLVRTFTQFLTQKRATPSITFNDGNGNNSKIYFNGANKTATVSNSYLNGFQMQSSDTGATGYSDVTLNYFANSEF